MNTTMEPESTVSHLFDSTEEHENLREALFRTTGTEKYENVLSGAQQYLSQRITGDITTIHELDLKDYILKYITDYSVTCSLTDEPAVLTEHIYHDMAGLSFITREKLFELEDFEELDINAWNDVDMIVGGKRVKTGYRFLSPQHANDIHRRMMQPTNTVLDDAMPYAVTDLGKGIRIACLKTPLVDEELGVASSIRMVSGSTITRERLTAATLTDKMLDFLSLCIRHGISVCFSGETGSGKTTVAGFLLYDIARDLRTFTIEEGSREWNFIRRDEDGHATNSIVHMKTRPSDDPRLNINQNKGLQIALRFNPTIIGVGEMRSDEAYAAAEASNTGHTVVSTVHANSASDAPDRIVGLCKKAYDFSDSTLMRLVSNAFPIHVYQEFLTDGMRRVTEIIEVLGFENGQLKYNTLVEFYSVTGETKVIGDFIWRNPISDKLHQRLLKKGATRKQLEPFRNVGG